MREAAQAASRALRLDTASAQLSLEQSRGVDLLVGGVLRRHVLDERLGDLLVGGVPVGDDLPLLAVPLLDAAVARAFVVGAGDLDRLQHAFEAQLLDARVA